MGRLLNPGLGELVDRLTILRLKLAHSGGRPAADIQHFVDEHAQLTMLLDRRTPPVEEAIRLLQIQLQHQNAQLWTMEEDMAGYVRELLVDPVPVAALGMDIWKANQERNRIIQELNKLAGTDAGPEKL